MANCKIILNINNKTYQFDSYKSKEEWEQSVVNLQEITTILLGNSNISNQLLKLENAITSAVQNKILIKSLENNNTYQVPTHSGQELKALYPDLDWAAEVPNVVLIDNHKGIYSKNYLYCTRLKAVQGDVFIVPKDNVKAFALLTKALELAKEIEENTIEVPKEIEDIYNQLGELQNNSKANWLKEFHRHRNSVLNDFLDRIDVLSRKHKINERKKRIEKLLDYMKKHPKNQKQEELKLLQEELAIWEKETDSLLTEYREYVENLKEMEKIENLDGLKESGKYKFEDDRFNEILSNHEHIKRNKKSKTFESVGKFVEDFITDKQYWENVLPPGKYGNVKQAIDNLLGLHCDVQTSGIVYAIESKFTRNENFISSISVENLTKLLKSEGLIGKNNTLHDDELFKLLKKIYTGVTNYKLLKIEGDNIYFKKKYNSNVLKFKYEANSDFQITEEGESSGNFIYSANIDGKHVYFASPIYLNKKTESVAYESLDDLKQSLIQGYGARSLYLNNSIFLSDVYSDCELVRVPSSRYSTNNIIMGLDYPRGSVHIPETLTWERFDIFIDTKFKEEDALLLKSLLITDNQKALFYSYYGNFRSYNGNVQYYNKHIIEVLEKAREISEAKTTYYIVNQSYSKGPSPKINEPDTRKHYIRVSKIESPFQQDLKHIKRQNHEAILTAIAEVFNQKGIKVELYSKEQMGEVFGDENIKGWHEGGIIFLNKDLATYHTALHEYSHLFIGVLRSVDEQKYNTIIDKLSDSHLNPDFESYFNEKFDVYNSLKSFRKLSEEGKRKYLAEEYFADKYAKHLSEQTTFGSIEDFCNIVDNVLVLTGIFPELSIESLLQSANNQYAIISSLSKEIKNAASNVGFSAKQGEVRSPIEALIDDNVTDDAETGIIKKC